jgi:16S rRNA (cytidine1402-2'-O)-methyltransferase
VTAVLSAAGVLHDSERGSGFVFAGFLPTKAGERATAVAALAGETQAVVVLEAPHRIEALAQALAVLGERWVTVGRELTKQFEEIATLRADALVQWLADDTNRLRGEFALVLHPAPATNEVAHDDRVLKLLLEQLPLKTAVKLAADISGEPRNALYERALALKTSATD